MNNSYTKRPVAESKNHQIYKSFLGNAGIDSPHLKNLETRGLTAEQKQNIGYGTKRPNNTGHMQSVLGNLDKQHDLDGVPGFFINDKGIRSLMSTTGLMMPCTDYLGKIYAILIRQDNPKKDKNGKEKNKYIFFSSNGKEKGAKVFQATHCPSIKGTAKEVSGHSVRVTEGVIKADIATALGEHYTFGIHGLNIPPDLAYILEECEISEIIISLDAGEDGNKDMIRAKARLVKLARDIGIDVKVEVWDEKYGKGIDDVLAAGHGEKTTFLTDEEIETLLAEAEEIDPHNGEWVYIVATEKFHNKKTQQAFKKAQFADKFLLRSTQDVNDILAEGFSQVDSITFLPQGNEIVLEEGIKKVNIWRDPQITPIDGDISLLLEHSEYVFPNELYRNIILDYLAYIVQFPGSKMRWALVVQGFVYGTGKSFYAEMMKVILGHKNVCSPSMEEIHGKYTHWQKNSQLIVVEELMARGKIDLMNKFKPMIVAPEARIREMYTPEYDMPNRYNFLMFTNHKDPIILEEGDRRYGIIRATSDKPKNKAYYDTLFQWLNEPKTAGKLLNSLMHRDISQFNYSVAPMTQAKQGIIDLSRSPLETWVSDCVSDQCWPFNRNIIVLRHLMDEEVCPRRFTKYSPQKWAAALKKSGAIRYSQAILLPDKSKAKVWLVGPRKDILINEPVAEIQRLYLEDSVYPQKQSKDQNNPLAKSKPI